VAANIPGITLEQLALVLRADVGQLHSALAQATADVNRFSRSVEQASDRAAETTQGVTQRLTSMLGRYQGIIQGVAAGLTTVFVAAALEAGRFEDTMNRLRILLTNQGREWSGARVQAMAFLRTLTDISNISEGALAQGLVSAATRGFNLEQSMRMVTAATRIAKATGMDFGEALHTITLAAAGYGRQLARLGIITREELKNGIDLETVLKRIDKQFSATQGPATVTKELTRLGHAATNLLQVLGTPLQAPLARFLEMLVQGVMAVTKFVESLNPAIVQAVAFGAVVFGGATGLTKLLSVMASSVPILGQLTQSMGLTRLAGVQLGAGLAASSNGIVALGGRILGLMGPVGLVITAITLLYTAWSKNWFGIRDAVESAVPRIIAWFDDLVLQIHAVIDVLGEMAKEEERQPDLLQRIARAVGEQVVGMFKLWWDWIVRVNDALGNLYGFLGRILGISGEVGTFGERVLTRQRELINEHNYSVLEVTRATTSWAAANSKASGSLKGIIVGGGEAGSALKKLVAELKEAIATQVLLFEFGKVGINAVIAAYMKLINNALVPNLEKLRAIKELQQTLLQISEQSIEKQRLLFEMGLVGWDAVQRATRNAIDTLQKATAQVGLASTSYRSMSDAVRSSGRAQREEAESVRKLQFKQMQDNEEILARRVDVVIKAVEQEKMTYAEGIAAINALMLQPGPMSVEGTRQAAERRTAFIRAEWEQRAQVVQDAIRRMIASLQTLGEQALDPEAIRNTFAIVRAQLEETYATLPETLKRLLTALAEEESDFLKAVDRARLQKQVDNAAQILALSESLAVRMAVLTGETVRAQEMILDRQFIEERNRINTLFDTRLAAVRTGTLAEEEAARLVKNIEREKQTLIDNLVKEHEERRRQMRADVALDALRFAHDIGVATEAELIRQLNAERALLDQRGERYRQLTREVLGLLQTQLTDYIDMIRMQTQDDVVEYLRRLQALRTYLALQAETHKEFAELVKRVDREITTTMAANWEQTLDTIRRIGRSTVDSLSSGLGQWVREVVGGTATVWDAFRNLLNRLASGWADTLGRMVEEWSKRGLEKLFENLRIRFPAPSRPLPGQGETGTAPAAAAAAEQQAAAQAQQQAAAAVQTAATSLGDAGAAGALVRASTTMETQVSGALIQAATTIQTTITEAALLLKSAAEALMQAALRLTPSLTEPTSAPQTGVGPILSLIPWLASMQGGGMVHPPTGAQVLPALLHRGEEVVAAGHTEQATAEIGPSGQPIQVNVNINAIDTQTGFQFLLRNRKYLADAVDQAMRSNHVLRRRIVSNPR